MNFAKDLLEFGLDQRRLVLSTDPPPQRTTLQDLHELDRGGIPDTPRMRAVKWLLDQGQPEPAVLTINPGAPAQLTNEQSAELDRIRQMSMDAIAVLVIAPFWRQTTTTSHQVRWSVANGVPASEVQLPARGAVSVGAHNFADYRASVKAVADTMADATPIDFFRMRAQSRNPGLGFALKLGMLGQVVRDRVPFTLIAIDVISAWVATTVQLLKHDLLVPRPDAPVFSANVQPVLPVPAFSAFPGGHAVLCTALAEVLAAMVCRQDSDASEELAKYSLQVSRYREMAGLHCGLDTDAGIRLGSEMAKSMIDTANASAKGGDFIAWSAVFAQAQQEWP